MAYDRQHLKVDFLFKDISSDEIALTGFCLSEAPGWTGAAAALGEIALTTGTGEAVFAAMRTLMAGVPIHWANYSRLYGVKIAAIDTAGHYLGDAKVYETAGPETGTVSTTLPQATIVCSLRSASAIGSANYGRMYLPHSALELSSGTSASNGTQTALVLTAFKTMLNTSIAAINADVTDTLNPFIMSNQAPKPSKQVLQLRVGSVTDTQRRRRNRIPEVYSTVAR